MHTWLKSVFFYLFNHLSKANYSICFYFFYLGLNWLLLNVVLLFKYYYYISKRSLTTFNPTSSMFYKCVLLCCFLGHVVFRPTFVRIHIHSNGFVFGFMNTHFKLLFKAILFYRFCLKRYCSSHWTRCWLFCLNIIPAVHIGVPFSVSVRCVCLLKKTVLITPCIRPNSQPLVTPLFCLDLT